MKRLWIGVLLGLLLGCQVWGFSREEEPVRGYVALTFDDGPSGALTEELLNGLRERNARATFFLCGYRMEQYPGVLDRYLPEGHEIGVHSTGHLDMTTLSPSELQQDIQETARKIRQMTGVQPRLMRPPGGAYNEAVRQEAREEHLSIVLWSVDPRDWASRDAGAVLHTMAMETGNGDIILMHDMSESSIRAALKLVDTLQGQGYEFVTVSELAALAGQTPEPGAVYEEFPVGTT